MKKALQDLANPSGGCFGCGPANEHGLRLKSFWDDDGVHVVARMLPEDKYCGLPGLVYGGYLAMLCDCHSNWTCIASHYKAEQRAPGSAPKISCATARLNIHYLKPTPMGTELLLKGRIDGETGRKTKVICEIYAGEELTVRADSLFVRVDPDLLLKKASDLAG